jgi:integrase
MPTRALTAAAVLRIKPPAGGQADYFDKGYPGLALRVSYGGAKTWVYFYRLHGGKLRRLSLGRFPAMELAGARTAWQDARKAVGKGENPARRKPVAAGTFAAIADEWLKRDQKANRSHDEVKRVLDRDVKPEWEDRQFASIARSDVRDLIDGIADRGAVTYARRVHAHLHRLFQWAFGRDLVERNPVAGLPKPTAVIERDRKLTDAELAVVWKAASQTEWPFGPLFRLLILTGARREEIGALRWYEIQGDVIELKGARTKPGEPHIIPLSSAALEIVESLPRVARAAHVFTTTGATAVSGFSKAKRLLDQEAAKLNDGRALPDWRLHDLRRTMASGMQRLGVSLQVVEAVLGHISGSRAGVVGIYQQHDYAAEKKAALEAWARHVVGLVSERPAEVIPMRRLRNRGGHHD